MGSVPGALLGGFIVTLSTLTIGASDQVAEGATASRVTLLTGVLLIAVLAVRESGVLRLRRERPPVDVPTQREAKQEVGV